MKKIFNNWHNYLKEDKQVDSKKVAKAVIFNDEVEVLLLATDNNPQFEGHWDLPGGHLKQGEGVEDGLRREVYEETGLNIQDVEIVNSPTGRKRFFCASFMTDDVI